MSDVKNLTDRQLQVALNHAFNELSPAIEELIKRGWEVTLNLPTAGIANSAGYFPMSLGSSAGFEVSKKVSPSDG